MRYKRREREKREGKKKERKKGKKGREKERKGLFRLTESNVNILIWIKISNLYFVELKASKLSSSVCGAYMYVFMFSVCL